MSGWTWCLIGLAFIFVELAVPSGFYLFLLGVSGILVGFIVLTGIVPGVTAQLVLFSVVAVVTCFCLARKLQERIRGRSSSTTDAVGKVVKVGDSFVAPGATGRGELWGSTWTLRNVGEQGLESSSEALVVGVEGLTLLVKRR
jgi:membrane protein implicated in regulation of membrane protease activity